MRRCPRPTRCSTAKRMPFTSSDTTVGARLRASARLTSTVGHARLEAVGQDRIVVLLDRREHETLDPAPDQLLDDLDLAVRIRAALATRAE